MPLTAGAPLSVAAARDPAGSISETQRGQVQKPQYKTLSIIAELSINTTGNTLKNTKEDQLKANNQPSRHQMKNDQFDLARKQASYSNISREEPKGTREEDRSRKNTQGEALYQGLKSGRGKA